MRLKVLTTFLLVAGLLLLVGWPIILGKKPTPDASRQEKAAWARTAFIYLASTCGVWISTATSAYLLARRTSRDFLATNRQNLDSLVESSLRDHEKRP